MAHTATPSKASLYAEATRLLMRNKFAADGTPLAGKSKFQYFFEKRIIKTPMGNRMR
jgi:hypothetical protein